MKRPRGAGSTGPAPAQHQSGVSGLVWAGGLFVAALVLAFGVYQPALDGPFVLDDLYLHFGRTDADQIGLAAWMAGRPLLGLSYYANYAMSGQAPGPYHVTNVMLHAAVAVLVFLIVRRALDFAEAVREGWPPNLVAALCGAVFLLHPIQTEAVAYVAGRSDVLSTLFAYGALAVFLRYRRPAIEPGAVAVVLALSLAALLSKQQAVAIPAALVLIDLLWNEGSAVESVKKNLKLHGLLALGAVAGAVWVFSVLARGTTAGLRVEGITPVEYFLTQGRVFWSYVRLLFLPVGQNIDPDIAIARGFGDVGSLAGLGAIAALAGGAWWMRRAWPLAAAGVLIFLALLAPTSTFIPIQDVMAERRLYFAFIGPLLILADVLRRWTLSPPAVRYLVLGAAVVILGAATHSRAALWGDEEALWKDTVAQSPGKLRPRFQLAHIYYKTRRCGDAAAQYEAASKLGKATVELLVDWGLALDCAGRTPEATGRLREALALERTYNSLAQLGMVLAKQGQFEEALPLLNDAVKADDRQAAAWGYRGNVLASQGKLLEASEDFRRALAINPDDAAAKQGLRYVEQRLGPPRQ